MRFRMIFPEALVLLLPLLFCFMDVFVVMADALFARGEGGTAAFRTLFSYLSSEQYTTNTAAEIGQVILGNSDPWMQLYSPFSVLRALIAGRALPASLWLPALIVGVSALLSALAGLLLLFSRGKILRFAPMADLVLIGGAAGALSPLVSLWVPAFSTLFSQGADTANALMLPRMLSVEAVLLLLLLLCITPPTLSSLRRSAASARGVQRFTLLTARPFQKRGFVTVKIATLLSALIALAASGALVLLPVTTVGGALDLNVTWDHLVYTLKYFFAALRDYNGTQQSALTLTSVLLELAFFCFLLLTAVFALWLLWKLMRVLLMRRRTNRQGKRKCRPVGLGRTILRLYTAAFLVFGVMQAVLMFLWLTQSPVAAHLNLSDVGATLPVLYLTALMVRDMCRLHVGYVLLAFGGAAFALSAGELARSLRNKNEQ